MSTPLLLSDPVPVLIERLRAEKPDAPVVVQAHADARNELLITAMDAARLAGAVDVSIAELN